MNEEKVLGIDVSKNTFDVALMLGGKFRHKKFNNDAAGFDALSKWLARWVENETVVVCLEATGIYGEALSEYLHDQGHRVSVVNPARIKGYAQSELVRAKTDKIDATLIARFCAALRPEAWTPPPKEVRELRDLVRRLDALHGMHQQEANRLESANGVVAERLRVHLAYLKEEIDYTRQLIRDHIDQDPDMKRKRDLLESIPGVGEATIQVVLSEFSDVGQFKNAKALAAYIGVTPSVKQSGTSVKGRGAMSRMGRSRLRKSFFMPALVALRHNPVMKDLKARLTAAGKAKMTIVGAAMRKLIHLIYGVLKNGVPFRADFA